METSTQRRMTEQQRVTWLLVMPACTQVNNAMQDLPGVNYNTGELCKDMPDARQARDLKDTHTVLNDIHESKISTLIET